METFPKDLIETVESQIITKSDGGHGRGRGWSLSDGEIGIAVFGSGGLDVHGR